MERTRQALRLGVIASVAILASDRAALANLTIVPTWDASITSDPNAATIQSSISAAIQEYQNRFADNITVTIRFQEMSSGLGQSNWWYYNIGYSTFRTAMGADATTASDAIALAHTPTGSTNPATGTGTVRIKTANIRALGIAGSFPSGLAGGVDGIIGLNTSIMNFTRPPGNSSKYDLKAVAQHEIDEILGLASSLDSGASDPLPQDLFRYTAAGARSFTTSGDDAYFSLDGSALLARFNQNSGGDHADWWSLGPHTPQVQDAFGTPGSAPDLGVELTALDVIGYNLVPGPQTVALLAPIVGLSLVRRRR